jgi:CheY-like chemotaxis protein
MDRNFSDAELPKADTHASGAVEFARSALRRWLDNKQAEEGDDAISLTLEVEGRRLAGSSSVAPLHHHDESDAANADASAPVRGGRRESLMNSTTAAVSVSAPPPRKFSSPVGDASRARDGIFAESPAGQRRVLFIDDNADVRDVCSELLRRAGFRVDVAEDGEAGWEAITTKPFDLVITDHNMPRLSGLELVRRIRSMSSTLPVILVSGNVPWDEPDLQWTLRPGVVIQKPFGLVELMATVKELLDASTHIANESNDVAPASRFIPSALVDLPAT